MSAIKQSPMLHIYRRMEDFGYKKKYVREKLLPSWWRDETAATKAGLLHASMLIAEHTGLDPRSLMTPDVPLRFETNLPVRFKKHTDTGGDQCVLSSAIGFQVAALVADVMVAAYKPLPPTPAAIRVQVQSVFPGVVTLETLARWCWSQGVPVIHVADLPPHKPQAMALMAGERPTIVLCENRKSPSHLAFLIAHELSHIVKGHLEQSGGLHLDTSGTLAQTEGDEKDANDGACAILTGKPETAYSLAGLRKAPEQARIVTAYARANGVDPGVVLHNVAHHNDKHRPLAMATLNIVEDGRDGVAFLQGVMRDQLDWGSLPDDAEEFLIKICGKAVRGSIA